MIRHFALFLAVGFLAAATFLVVSDERPRPPTPAGEAPSLDAGPDARTHGGRASLACAPARRAPTHAPLIAPRRFEEVVPKEELVLDVVREDGRPIANASLRFVNGGIAIDTATDAYGRARVAAEPETSAFLTVKGADFYQHTDFIALEPGLRRIVVPDRKTVVAQVLVRGQTPRDPIRIGYQLPFNLAPLWAMSDPQGRVEFFNLPQNVQGTFTWPEGYRREDARWGFFSTRLPSEAEWTRAVAAVTDAESTSSTGRVPEIPAAINSRLPNVTWHHATFSAWPTTVTLSGDVDVQVRLTAPVLESHWKLVAAAVNPSGGTALAGEARVDGNAGTLNKVLAQERQKALDESVETISRRIEAAWRPHGLIPCDKGRNDGNSGEVIAWVTQTGADLPANITEIRLIPTRTLPIRILDPSGAPVAAYLHVAQGWCSFNANPAGGGATLVLDEDVYASGFSSVIEAHLSSTGAPLPIENVSMTWSAAGAPSATVSVGYPPAIQTILVDVIDDQPK